MFWFYSKQTTEKEKLNLSLNVQFQKNVMEFASQLKKIQSNQVLIWGMKKNKDFKYFSSYLQFNIKRFGYIIIL